MTRSPNRHRLGLGAALLLASALGSTRALAASPLVERARAMGLGQSIGWRKLLHYRRGLLGVSDSEIEGATFFLAPNGRQDPEAELEATLLAFETPLRAGAEDEHPLCRFAARRAWLDEALHFEGVMHAPNCPALERFRAELDAESVAIVYSAPYLGAAASAMGHAFLLVRKRPPFNSSEPSERLDHGLDFVAVPDTKNPVFYVFKGLAGLFPGVVSLHSYEEKVREYGGYEERDLWEYEIALTPEELDLYIRHLFELSKTTMEFFYLRKNCAYSTLASIEAAAPASTSFRA